MRLIFWALFAVMTGVYLTMVLWSLPIIVDAGHGRLPFDLHPAGYHFDFAVFFLEELSEEGRLFYLNVQQMLDSAYPALFGVVMTMAFVHLFRGYYRAAAIGFALAGMVFDYLENAAVAVLLQAGPRGHFTPEMVATASMWTQAKSVAVTLALLMLIAGLVMAFVAKRKDLK